jgi:hypothetical protein
LAGQRDEVALKRLLRFLAVASAGKPAAIEISSAALKFMRGRPYTPRVGMTTGLVA